MKIKVNYTFAEEYIPPRCRKPRSREINKTMNVTIKEISVELAPVAMIVTDYETRDGEFGVNDTAYRWYKNKLYKLYRVQSGDETGNPHTMKDVEREIDRAGYGYFDNADEKKRVSDIKKVAKRYLIIDGEIYREAGEPRYYVVTFGLGHNHGGSSLSIIEYYNDNISKDNYFNAFQREEAIKCFEWVALGRGDTKSVKSEYVDNIKVLIPEAVKCKPQKEHGDGHPFLNKLNAITECAPDTLSAGFMAMALAFDGI